MVPRDELFVRPKIRMIFSQAIKEAQKTLDKALDIQEGDEPAQDKQGKALLCEKSLVSKSTF